MAIHFEGNIPVERPARRGFPLNAYKQFKAIDRNGDAYYMAPKGSDSNGY